MLPIDPISLRHLTEAIHQDRLRELERQRRSSQTRQVARKNFAPVLNSLGRGLSVLGLRLQGQPRQRQTPTSV